jgi:hypothetical protein
MKADTQYQKKIAEVRLLIQELSTVVSAHEMVQMGDSANWGYFGDLEYAANQLITTIRFLKGGK